MWMDILKARVKVNMEVLRKVLENWSNNHKDRGYSIIDIIDDIAEEVTMGSAYKHAEKYNVRYHGAAGHLRKKFREEPNFVNQRVSNILRDMGYISKIEWDSKTGTMNKTWEYGD